MSDRPQFRIKDLVGFTLAMSLPLAMISSDTPLAGPGWILLLAITLGGVGYLVGRRSP